MLGPKLQGIPLPKAEEYMVATVSQAHEVELSPKKVMKFEDPNAANITIKHHETRQTSWVTQDRPSQLEVSAMAEGGAELQDA